MTQAHKYLFDEILKLPVEKIGKVLTFVRFIEQESESELILDPIEEDELHGLLTSDDFITSSDLLAKIEALPND